MAKLPQNIEPFLIESDKKLCGMNSALQCLLSLPIFLKSLNLPKNAEILKIFQSILQKPNDSQTMKKFIEQNRRNVDFQDAFAFIDSFIDIMTKNKEYDTENLFCGDMSEINVCSDCEVPDEVNKQKKFSSIGLSFTESLRIIYVPKEIEGSPILTSITCLENKKDFVLIQPKSKEIVIINNEEVFKSHSNLFYAFELPEYSKNNSIIFIQLKYKSGGSMPVPLLCEIPKGKEMKDAILKRIQSLFKARSLSIQIQNNISKTIEFNKYSLCSEFIQVTVSGYSQILKDRKPIFDEDINLSLSELFDGYISLSKLEDEKYCKFCKEKNKPYFRKRLTKLPQILIFRIGKTEETNNIEVKIPEFICLSTNDYNEFDEIGNPDEYKVFKNINIYELRATSNHYGNSRNLKTISNVKRENKWYRIFDDKIAPKDESPKESSNVDLLFYEIVSDTKKNNYVDSKDEEKPRPSSKRTTKQKISYSLNGNSIVMMLDHNVLINATDVIKFFRQRINNEKINGFKIKDKSYFDGDKTLFDDIFPPEKKATQPVEILIEKPVSKPPSKPSSTLEANIRKNLKKIPSTSGKNISYALIDYSSSMIACFKSSGIRRSEVAVNSINRFLRNGSLYCNSDNFFFYEDIMKPELKKAEYDKKKFKDRSDLQSNLDYVVDLIIKKGGFQNKRILLISDGVFIPDDDDDGDDEHKETLMDVYKKIINNQIILDVILLKNDTNIVKELCAVAHLSGGYYFYPESLDDLNEFIDEEKFINFQKRNISFLNYADEKIIENITKNIFATKNIDSYKKHNLKQEMILASPFYEYETKDDNKIEEEIDNCVATQNDKKQFFSIYRLSDRDGGFINQRAIVFLKSKQGPLILFEIFFPQSYPDEEPLFKLASDIKMKKIPNYMFNVLDTKYTKRTKLVDLIKELNKRLQLEIVDDDENDFDSFDKIEGVYHTQYGEEEKNFDD